MVAVVAAEDADRALALLTARHVAAWVVGEVLAGEGDVRMVGTNAAS
jgi:phosphoribosylformylglycinamidine cyclo-ligase